jgi:hypothetical protein
MMALLGKACRGSDADVPQAQDSDLHGVVSQVSPPCGGWPVGSITCSALDLRPPVETSITAVKAFGIRTLAYAAADPGFRYVTRLTSMLRWMK